MTLSLNQIRSNARQFSLDWKDESQERAESQTFWNEFFAVFGVNRRKVGVFEAAFKKLKGTQGFIDVYWPKKLICEQKSRGADLDKAVTQALEYLQAIAKVAEDDLPRYVIVCDFEKLQLHDLITNQHQEILVTNLADHVELFGFISGYEVEFRVLQEAANIAAAERMGRLHDQLQENGYDGHELKVMLIRLLFCMFAEDTGIFNKCQFEDLIAQRTAADGSDLADRLNTLFHVLNQEKRLKNLDEQLASFAYINGELFAEPMPPAAFDAAMRHELLEACRTDWSHISPEIFGALFQSVMDKTERRNLGAHYTSEENILKVINSLFLDELKAELAEIKAKKQTAIRKSSADKFHQKIAALTFLDPACGCGNFLIVAYRELRLLELEVIELVHKKGQLLDVDTMIRCNVNQFYGIEIDEFPSQIARVAMWLIDHQMNRLVSERFGIHYARIPLKQSAHIVHGNALQVDWAVTDYIFGNPPFLGYTQQSKNQKIDLANVCREINLAGSLDFVAGWYVKAVQTLNAQRSTLNQTSQVLSQKCAFVSTNSITQGEQVPVLWSWMLAQGIHIQFAHRTFQWSSAAKGKAAVHCVIIGFGKDSLSKKTIFEYDDISADPVAIQASNINPYLADATSTFIGKRRKPLCQVSEMSKGSQPTDGGNLLFSDAEKTAFIILEPLSEQYIRPFLGADEFINNVKRWCLWLENADPSDVRKMPHVQGRLKAVQVMRLASSKEATKKWAIQPALFTENRQPTNDYISVPRVSSERRLYLPIGFISKNIIASDALLTIPNATLLEFGIITSLMHNAWMRVVCGRLESRYRYSASIVYNNFPWPLNPTPSQKQTIETAAQAVLDARAAHPTSSLADLYDPLTMPANLTKSHQQLDKAVDAAYTKRKFATEAERVAFLFELYQQYTEEAVQK